MTKKIYLVRHGSTEGNEQLIHQTATTPLSPSGLKQAHSLGERFKSLPADVILASTMTRAHQTAEAIAKATNLPLFTSELLVEMSGPSVIHNKPHADVEAKSAIEAVFGNFLDHTFRHSDEETFLDLKERATGAINMILQREEEKIIVVTHGLTLKMIFGLMIFGEVFTPELYVRMVNAFRNSNTGITICEYEMNRVSYMPHEHTDWRCVVFNDHAHLG